MNLATMMLFVSFVLWHWNRMVAYDERRQRLNDFGSAPHETQEQ